MTKIGECLVFYLKYYPEMAKLYLDGEDIPSLPEAEDSMEKARRVGKAADEQAAAFLAECGKLVQEYFAKVGAHTVANKPAIETANQIEKHWSISYRVWPVGAVFAPSKPRAGISLLGADQGKTEVVTWFWHVNTTQQLSNLNYLKATNKSKGSWEDIDGLQEGAVALGRVPIVLPTTGFELNCTEIFKQVQSSVEVISREDLKLLHG